MIEKLRDARLLSLVENEAGLIGYRFQGPLLDAFEALDGALIDLFQADCRLTAHSCTTMLQREALEAIGFFGKLPSIPLHAVPHEIAADQSARQSAWVLSPSTCYHTFGHLSGLAESWDLRCFTARGVCHRFEPSAEPTRLASFTMREFVLIGDADLVVTRGESMFERAVAFLGELHGDVSVKAASDVFYGENAKATRRVQLARGIKREILVPWNGAELAVGSRNLHYALFTGAYGIGSAEGGPAMHSACVAFGIERLLLALLARTEGHDPERLAEAVAESARAVHAT
ncbi:hypothetical protein ACFV27_38845 [Streptomyces antimycoticus]|uniref:hypothetical protein n=1 Tax=Streptomyces antimycoticus TaxID=68175 RepID=UPI0036915DEE